MHASFQGEGIKQQLQAAVLSQNEILACELSWREDCMGLAAIRARMWMPDANPSTVLASAHLSDQGRAPDASAMAAMFGSGRAQQQAIVTRSQHLMATHVLLTSFCFTIGLSVKTLQADAIP